MRVARGRPRDRGLERLLRKPRECAFRLPCREMLPTVPEIRRASTGLGTAGFQTFNVSLERVEGGSAVLRAQAHGQRRARPIPLVDLIGEPRSPWWEAGSGRRGRERACGRRGGSRTFVSMSRCV